MGLILDTSVIIAEERRGASAAELLKGVRASLGSEPIALSTISVIELEHGVWRTQEPAQAARRQKFLDDLFAVVPSYPLTFEIARRAGRIEGEAKRNGMVIPFQDLVIGATALEFDYAVGDAQYAALSDDPRSGGEATARSAPFSIAQESFTPRTVGTVSSEKGAVGDWRKFEVCHLCYTPDFAAGVRSGAVSILTDLENRRMPENQQQQIFVEWLSRYKGLFFKVIRAYAFTTHDQEDLFQEIATQVWRSIPSYRGDAAATTWIYRVALNTAMAWTQKERKHREGKQPLDSVDPAFLRALHATDARIEWLYAQIRELSVCWFSVKWRTGIPRYRV